MVAKGDAGSAGIRSGVPAAASASARTIVRRASSILKPLSPEGLASASAASAARRNSAASVRAPARIASASRARQGFGCPAKNLRAPRAPPRDSLIGAAAAEISAHAFANALRIIASLTFLDQTDRAHDLAGRAEATLQAVVGNKGLLHRMKPATLRYTFDRQDVGAVVTDCKGEARLTRRRSTMTVQTPHSPRSQPFWLPSFKACREEGPGKRDTRVIQLDRSRDAVHSESG